LKAEDVVAGFPEAIAVDPAAGLIYWTDNPPMGSLLPGRIHRVGLDGSGDKILVSSLPYPVGIALLPAQGGLATGKIYWTDGSTNDIHRAELDGSNPKTLVSGLASPFGIALDVVGGWMYWTHTGADPKAGAIKRARLDGSEVKDLLTDLRGPTTGIALDLTADKMYWGYVDPNIDSIHAGMIKRCNLDGSDLETIVSGLIYPVGVALDLDAGHVFWTDTTLTWTGGSLHRANLDGSDATLLLDALGNPRGIAVGPVPEPAALSLTAIGALLALRRRATRKGA
jgi:low density lipoprotein receptor-related protein 5/6